MIADLQPGEVVVTEKIDRISRLPLPEAERLVASIRAKGARLAVPGVVDFTDLANATDAITRIVLESVQELLLKLALQMARDDYETRRERQRQGVQLAKTAHKYAGRIPDTATHERIVALRRTGLTIKRTAELAGCSTSRNQRRPNPMTVGFLTTESPDNPCLDDVQNGHGWPCTQGTAHR
jgi:DNA invertase Pin-like site-specific DNA recombinase